MKDIFHERAYILSFLLMMVFSGCAFTNRVMVDMTSPIINDMNKSFNKNPDIQMMEDSMPFSLNGLSGLIDISPNNRSFLINAAHAYFGYTFAFVEDKDVVRARKLYIKSRDYGLRALFRKSPKEILDMPLDEFKKKVGRLGKRDAPAMFWATVSWLSYININLGDFSVYLEIPKCEILTDRLMEVNDRFYYASPYLLKACYYGAQPEISGGQPEKAKEYFKKGIELSNGKFLMHHLFYAKYYAVRTQDKAMFLDLLRIIKDAPEDILPDVGAVTNVCKMKADLLMNSADDYF